MSEGPRTEELRSGHTEISWSIVLDSALSRPLDPGEAQARIREAWPERTLGPAPAVVPTDRAGYQGTLTGMADRPYAPGSSLGRVAVVGGERPRLVVAGYHGALDGIGMLALTEIAVGEPVRTLTRGVDPVLASRPATRRYLVERLLEALVAPPSRFVPDTRGEDEGDHLLRLGLVAAEIRTPDLVAAAARALGRWNQGRGRATKRIVVAVGASRRPGSEAALSEESAWFRFVLPHPDAETARRVLRDAVPAPRGSSALGRPVAGGVARALAARTGSSFLVSSLGLLDPAGPVEAAALYPSVHGRSGIAVGAVTVGRTLTLTLRARRSEFSREGAMGILRMVSEELPDPPRPKGASPG